jgi:hypothetical protein
MRTLPSALAVALVTLAQPASAENLIRNGGFERRDGPDPRAELPPDARAFYAGAGPSPFDGWLFGGGWDGGKYSVHASQQAHGGRHSCEIRCQKKGRGGIASSPFKLRPGTVLKVSFWIKASNAAGGRIFLNFEGTPGDGWDRMDLPAGTYDWTKVTRRCVVPARHERADGQMLMIFIYSKAAGSIWIDDVSVETVDVNELAEAPDTPALTAPRPKAIPEPAGSIGYRIAVASALKKVLPDTDYAPAARPHAAISLARNESEAVQVVVEAPWRDVTVGAVELSRLDAPGGAVIPAAALSWRRVEFVETTFTPPYPVDRVGLYPDPLMPPGRFTVRAPSRTPVWVSVRTAPDTPPGTYTGTITIRPEGMKPSVIPLTVTVWDFALTDETHLRTLTWLGTGVIRAFYGLKWSPQDNRRYGEIVRRYQDLLLAHRLGPGGEVAAHVPKDRKTGAYDFSGVDAALERLIGKGMNAFIMGTAPNLQRAKQKEYSPQFIAEFTDRLKAYGDHLRKRGWIDKAYVYTYDEAPRSAWPEVKKISKAIRSAAPGLRILQCLNQPEGVQALEGFVDVFDVYVAQYHRTGVARLQQRGTEVWLAVCCYPMDHPNLFIEYPLLDARIIPLFCWKYRARGFEYWSPNAWGPNWRAKPPDQWPNARWNPNTFGRYNGDGYLLYPGPDGAPYPSIRLEALRDGLEDYEYLWLLDQLARKAQAPGKGSAAAVQAARGVLQMDGLIQDDGTFANDAERYFAFREKVAGSIVELKKLIGEK